MNIKTIDAIKKIYESLNMDGESLFEDIKNDYITLNQARNGRAVVWYLAENAEMAVYTDDLSELSQEEIEIELC